MKQEIYISLFIRFLKIHGIYQEYMELWNKRHERRYSHVRSWLVQRHPPLFIFNAFTWPSGSWAYYHRLWVKCLEKITNS